MFCKECGINEIVSTSGVCWQCSSIPKIIPVSEEAVQEALDAGFTDAARISELEAELAAEKEKVKERERVLEMISDKRDQLREALEEIAKENINDAAIYSVLVAAKALEPSDSECTCKTMDGIEGVTVKNSSCPVHPPRRIGATR